MRCVVITVVLLFFCVIATISVPQDIVNPPTPPKVFRKDYVYEPSTERFYKAHKIIHKFQDAVNLCKYEGAELAVPKTEGEADILKNMFRTGSSAIWVGLHDIYAEGSFVTLNGSSIDEVYSKWSAGEPNNVNDEEHCVLMIQSKEYNDVPCSHKYDFICSKDESAVHYNWLCETYDKDYFYNVEGDRCYKVHKTPRTWHDAFKVCRAEEAALVVVNSASEAKFLVDIFNTQHPESSLKGNFEKNSIHVDFSDLVSPGVFQTSDGLTLDVVGYEDWAPGQPDNHQGKEHCGSIFRSGQLNDEDCTVRSLFFCEKVLGAPQAFTLLERAGYNKNMENPA